MKTKFLEFTNFFLRRRQGSPYEMIAPWKETTLPTLPSNFDLNNIYNIDEFGSFYKALPNKWSKEKCVGGKHSKIKLIAAANTASEKFLMFVIGKSKYPRCFKGINKSTL